MADHDVPNRIDRVFADGRLIDEAVEAAAQDAIDRHRDAGRPIVIARNGHPVEVPVSALSQDRPGHESEDSDSLLSDIEFSKERTPKELGDWVDDRLAAIRRCVDANEPALLHRGLFKRFYEEMYVFRLFVQRLYGERDDVRCALKPHNDPERGYDAIVLDHSSDPKMVTYVQLTTTTFNRDESRRMRYLVKHGWVPWWGPPPTTDEFEELELVVSRAAVLERAFADISQAVARKAPFSHGRDYVLVVSFDDVMWFGTDEDVRALRTFVDERLPAWRLNVATLYIVGISGRTFLSFPASAG